MKLFESPLLAFLSVLRLICFNLYRITIKKHYKTIKNQLQRLKMNIYNFDYFKKEEYCLLQVENIFYDKYEHRYHMAIIDDRFYITIPLENINSMFYFYYPLSEKQKNKITNFITNKETT